MIKKLNNGISMDMVDKDTFKILVQAFTNKIGSKHIDDIFNYLTKKPDTNSKSPANNRDLNSKLNPHDEMISSMTPYGERQQNNKSFGDSSKFGRNPDKSSTNQRLSNLKGKM